MVFSFYFVWLTTKNPIKFNPVPHVAADLLPAYVQKAFTQPNDFCRKMPQLLSAKPFSSVALTTLSFFLFLLLVPIPLQVWVSRTGYKKYITAGEEGSCGAPIGNVFNSVLDLVWK